MTRRVRWRLYDARICFLCQQQIAPDRGLYHWRYDVLVHQGVCAARISKAERDFSKSASGRRLPVAEVFRRLAAGRHETTSSGTKQTGKSQLCTTSHHLFETSLSRVREKVLL